MAAFTIAMIRIVMYTKKDFIVYLNYAIIYISKFFL